MSSNRSSVYSNGVQQKFYDEQENCWYKEDCLGTEGLSEFVTTLLLKNSDMPHAVYTVCEFTLGRKKTLGCRSENFLGVGEALVSTYSLFKMYRNIDIAEELAGKDVEDKVRYFVDEIISITGIQNFGKYLTNILQLDAFTKNDDRHFRNICVIRRSDNSFKLAPIFDNGGAFLSDKYSYGNFSEDEDISIKMQSVEAKPFSSDFDEQLQACEALYGSSTLKLSRVTLQDLKCVESFYGEKELRGVYAILRESERKYSYIMSTSKHIMLDDLREL